MKTRALLATLAATLLSLPATAPAQEPPAAPLPAAPVPGPPPAPVPAPTPAPAPPEPDDTIPLVIEARGLRHEEPPLFFSARAETTVQIGAEGWQSETRLRLKTLQGKAEALRVGLAGDGQVTAVEGEGIAAWSVGRRREGEVSTRFLELRPADVDAGELTVTVRAEGAEHAVPCEIAPLLFAAGDAVGFSGLTTVAADAAVDLTIVEAAELSPVDAGADRRRHAFQSFGRGGLRVALRPSGAALAAVELTGVKLDGEVDADGRGALFTLTAEAQVRDAEGGEIAVLSGHAAVTELPEGGAFALRLRGGDAPAYHLDFRGAGTFPVRFAFRAGIIEEGARRRLDFRVPPGAVVPATLRGLPDELRFDPACAVFPRPAGGGAWTAFLPADGAFQVAWDSARDEGEGELFFASEALVSARVGAGLLRQDTALTLRPLQGEIAAVEIDVAGEGEILRVEGGNVLGWTVSDAEGGTRLLEVRLSQPASGPEALTVRSQQALGEFPVSAQPLRLTPRGAVRHSGHLHLSNEGAVALEVAEPSGLTQLAPEQWPGAAAEGVRQAFVYRFPSGEYSLRVLAEPVLPEVGVQQILVYEMTETDRVIGGRAELDIREAPLREWTLTVPDGYSVDSVSGAGVADYSLGSEAADGQRSLKVLFGGPVSGRQLISFRLAKNEPAAAGAWSLPPVGHPAAKGVRGFVGAATARGYRAAVGSIDNLAEVPMAYFPAKVDGIQQTFRLREGAWAATLDVTQLPQSVQAECYHLYTLREGAAHASVLINYFVSGTPVGEWTLAVPDDVGNLTVEGQNVQNWTRGDDGTVTVSLHQPVLGPATLHLGYSQTVAAGGGTLNPGTVTPMGIAGERGYLQVVSPEQLRHEVATASGGLLKLEPSELPAHYQLLANAPSLAVYQYSARPFELALEVAWHAPVRALDQVVEFGRHQSRVSGDGQIVTDSRYYVLGRGGGALRLRLPEGADLWEARVDGNLVNARTDGDATLVPLPPGGDAKTPAEVALRLAGEAAGAKRVTLSTPLLEVPSLFSTWRVEADPDRLLVPDADTAELLEEPVLTETGFAWLRGRGTGGLFALLVLAVLGAALAKTKPGGALQWVGLGLLATSLIVGITEAARAAEQREVNRTSLEFVAPVVEAGEAVTLNLKNAAAAEAMLSVPGVVMALVGIAIFLGAQVMAGLRPPLLATGAGLVAWGLLMQRGGAIAFFAFLALLVGVALLLPALIEALRATANRPRPPAPDPGDGGSPGGPGGGTDDGGDGEQQHPNPAAPAAAAVALAGVCIALLGENAAAAPATAPLAPDLLAHTLTLADDRLGGELVVRVTGEEGDTAALLFAPAVLTAFEGDGLRLVKEDAGYRVVLERAGTLTAAARYELSVSGSQFASGGNHLADLPTPAAAVQTAALRYGEPGWEFRSPAAVASAPVADLPDGSSGALLTFGPAATPTLHLVPQRRDLAAEEAQFYVEVANLFVPSPGIVDGVHQIQVRPSRGQIASLECLVPEGFTVGSVAAENLESWRFDPASRLLRIDLVGPSAGEFALRVDTQVGTGPLPSSSQLMPLTVRGAAGQLGQLAVAFGGDAQPDAVAPEGLSPVNLDDFPAGLLPRDTEGNALASLHAAFRYGAEPGTLAVTAVEVAPQVHAEALYTLSLDAERLVLAADLATDISRAGIFSLSFPVPGGLEVEAVSGPSLAHWTESEQGGERIVTLHLNGRTLGRQEFAVQLAGPAPDDQASWPVPRVDVREASRQTGQLLVVPEQGLRAAAATLERVRPLDARALSDGRPGTLAYRLLQADWQVALELETLDTWVTAGVLHEVALRDGLTRTRVAIDYQVENAAVKTLRLRLPGLSAEEEKTVRASGEAVADIVKVQAAPDAAPDADPDAAPDAAAEDDLWELRFSRRILGTAGVVIEYQRGADRAADASETVRPAVLVDTRTATYWVALNASEHLDISLGDTLPDGWTRAEANAVPRSLAEGSPADTPLAETFRTAAPETPLSLSVRRHALADSLSLGVAGGIFTTAVATTGASVTEARLAVEVLEKSALELRLPEGAELLAASVNGETPGIVEVDGAHRFYVQSDDGARAEVAITWATGRAARGSRFDLAAPAFNVPLQNVRWDVVLPVGYALESVDGDLKEGEVELRQYDFDAYRADARARRAAGADEGLRYLTSGIQARNAGDNKRAVQFLSKAAGNSLLDAAGKEDAAVQLRKLQAEKALLGINSARQQLYLENEGDGGVETNEQLKQAASQNPVLRGITDFKPNEVESFVQGNTDDVDEALQRVVDRHLGQLSATAAAPALEIAARSRGEAHTFTRSVQVTRDKPLNLELTLRPKRAPSLGAGLLALLGAAALAWLAGWRRSKA